MGKTKKNYKSKKGGKVIASGGYGCVFDPALKCEGSTKRDSNKISKLMNNKHATAEYEEINKIKVKLDSIPNYQDYFLVNDATLCRPAKLTATDLAAYGDKCTALPKDDITKANINSRLDQVMALNIPNGGLPVDDYLYNDGTYQKIYNVHTKLVKLLKDGILPMNKNNVYHSDIKDSNVLIDDFTSSDLKARLIDWGLTVDYKPDSHATFPKSWRNRPLQFNVPFSVVIFTDSFYKKYSEYLKEGGKTDKKSLYPFVLNYLNEWMKERGAGHYKFINEIMFKLYNDTLDSISEDNRPGVIETEITIPTIVEYICDVLVYYTKYKPDGSLNLREYLDEVFIKIVDVWGFINVYYPILELLSNNYLKLKENEMKIFKQLQFIFNEYLYTPRHEPINMNDLYNDLKIFGNLIHIFIHGKRKTISIKEATAHGIKTKKNRKMNSGSSIVFKRKPLIKRFKNPFFLSLK
jgi:serine/threonine protein kinase